MRPEDEDTFRPFAPIDWHDQAACAYIGGDLWFPEVGTPSRKAKAVCRGCSVRAECLDYAMTCHETVGIWGGLSVMERRSLTVAAKAVA